VRIDHTRRGRWMRLIDTETGDAFYFFRLWRWWRMPWIGWAMFS
jgi:hypothetical protein